MTVEQRPGPRVIAGSLPHAGIQLTVTDPWGNAATVSSGSKPEYGPGGFEVLAPHVATYTVKFLDQTFEVQTHDGFSLVTFRLLGPEPEPEPEATMASRVTLHCQALPEWLNEFLVRARATHVKCIDNYAAVPGVLTIGRSYYDQTEVDARVSEGAAGADRIFDAIRAEIEKSPQVALWETPANEPGIWAPTVLASFVAFNQRLIQRFHQAEKKVIVGAISTGWPRLPSEDGGAMMRAVAQACQGADGVSFHEYGNPDMRHDAGSACLRYRQFHDFCVANGFGHPPVYITECGLDTGTGQGWKSILNGDEAEYVRQLVWYDSELRKDDYVECATVFTAGPLYYWDFEVTESLAMKLADALAAAKAAPEPGPETERVTEAPPEPGRTNGWTTVVQWLRRIKGLIRRLVGARQSPSHPDSG
jgi:hypothetical protein